MIVRIEQASIEHLQVLVPRMRLRAVREITQFGLDPLTVMEKAIRRSNSCWIGMVDDEPACLWGLETTTMLSDEVYLWLATTDLVEKYQFAFLRRSQEFVKKLSREYRRVWGVVEPDFDKSIVWLQWLGFKVLKANGARFRVFEKVTNNG